SHIRSSILRLSRRWEETPITPVNSPIFHARILERGTTTVISCRLPLARASTVAPSGTSAPRAFRFVGQLAEEAAASFNSGREADAGLCAGGVGIDGECRLSLGLASRYRSRPVAC